MSVRNAIRAELDALRAAGPLIAAPSPPFGYGSDLDCFDDVTDAADELDPNSTRGLAQAAYHLVTSARGSMPAAPDAGIDLRCYLNRGLTAAAAAELAGDVANEIKKDDRFAEVTVTTTQPSLDVLRVQIQIAPADTEIDTLSLVLAVTDAGVLLEAFA
jgi:hypothetical protein